MKTVTRAVASVVIAATASSVSVAAASAAPRQDGVKSSQVEHVVHTTSADRTDYKITTLSESTIRAYDRYVTSLPSGRYVARIPRSVANSAPAETAAVLRAIAQANARDVVTPLNRIGPPGGGGGNTRHGGYSSHWWGWEFWMDGYLTHKVVLDVGVGIGVAGMLETMGMPHWVAVHVAEGVAGLGAAFISRCAGRNGVTFKFYAGVIPRCYKRN